MGLDMYLSLDGKEVGYWRKHPNLHGYIVSTFANGVDECQEIPLKFDDVMKIIESVKEKKLPHTEGFFFGYSNSEDDVETLVIFGEVENQMRINPNAKLVYQASW